MLNEYKSNKNEQAQLLNSIHAYVVSKKGRTLLFCCTIIVVFCSIVCTIVCHLLVLNDWKIDPLGMMEK